MPIKTKRSGYLTENGRRYLQGLDPIGYAKNFSLKNVTVKRICLNHKSAKDK